VEIVRGAFQALNDGDPSDFLALYDPDIVLRVGPGAAIPGVFVGAAAVARRFAEFQAPFESYRVQALELIDAGDSVVVSYKTAGRGRLSGVEVESPPAAAVCTFRGGTMIRIDLLDTCAEALKAVGLEE
jgi:ketosteroid isomerase-like protein